MHPYMNEDAAWQHLKDLQQEMENSRLVAEGRPWTAFKTLGRLGARVWLLGGLAMRRPPRHNPSRGAASATLAAWKLRSPNR